MDLNHTGWESQIRDYYIQSLENMRDTIGISIDEHELEIPEDRCGAQLQGDPISEIVGIPFRTRNQKIKPAWCWRTVWKEGRCIWHADCENKPLEKLIESRTDNFERLDGAILRNLQINTLLSFANCGLNGAIFDNVGLERTNFTNADLRDTTFRELSLQKTKFYDADLAGSTFQNTIFRQARLDKSNIKGATFIKNKINSSNFTDSNLEDTRFRNVIFMDVRFTNSNIRDATFKEAQFPKSDFTNTNLNGSTFHQAKFGFVRFDRACLYKAEFPGATFHDASFRRTGAWDVDFSDTDLRNTPFPAAALYRANFQDSDVRDAEFTDPSDDQARPTNLEDTIFEGADLRGTNFTHARLFQAVLTDSRINSRTTFDDRTLYEQCPELRGWFNHQKTPDKKSIEKNTTPEEVTTPLQAAAWVHRRLESLYEENALSEEARNFHVSKKEAEREYHNQQRKKQRKERDYEGMLYEEYHYWILNLMYHLTNHGESTYRVLTSSAKIIVCCSLLYPIIGGFASNETGYVYQLSIPSWSDISTINEAMNSIISGIQILLQSLYFSTITFSTIGYGDLYPIGTGTKILIGIESLTGAIMVALFIFVLGRRTAR